MCRKLYFAFFSISNPSRAALFRHYNSRPYVSEQFWLITFSTTQCNKKNEHSRCNNNNNIIIIKRTRKIYSCSLIISTVKLQGPG